MLWPGLQQQPRHGQREPRNNVRIRERLRGFLFRPNMGDFGIELVQTGQTQHRRKRLACRRGEVVDFHGYEHKIEHATALGLGGARTSVCARFADWVRMRPDACLLAAYTASGKAAELVIRVFVPAVMAAASLIGVWRTKRWGWILALITDAALCLQGLWFLLDYARFAIRNTAWLAYDLCEFAALAVLLYRPVRGHFLGQNGGLRKATMPLARVSRASQAGKPLRILLYFTVAVVASCVATAFSLAIFMGQKNGGSRGFVLFLYFGLTTGCAASFLFALILTLLVRKFDPSRLWLWVLLGGSLAPCLIFALALIGRWFFVAGPFNLIFWAPETLFQVWWLTPPTGIFTAWVCYTMHPWVFSESRQTRRSA